MSFMIALSAHISSIVPPNLKSMLGVLGVDMSSIFQIMKLIVHGQFDGPRKEEEKERIDAANELKIKLYEKEGDDEDECRVCLCKIEEGEEIRELRCEHVFHRTCLDKWIGYEHRLCPLCRGPLAPKKLGYGFGEDCVLFRVFSLGVSRSRRDRWWLC